MRVVRLVQALWFVAMVLQVTGSLSLAPAVVVQIGSRAVLPCPGLKHYSDCGRVSWVFRRTLDSKDPGQDQDRELVRDGQCLDSSGHIHLLEDCSLRVHGASVEHVGFYACFHSHSAPKRRIPTVTLSLIKAFGHNLLDDVGCSLSSPDLHRFTVKKSKPKLIKPQSVQGRVREGVAKTSLWCNVTDQFSRKTWPFKFSSEDSTFVLSSNSYTAQVSYRTGAVVLSVLALLVT